MAKARQDQLKKEARQNIAESLQAKEERLRAEKAAEKAEEEKIEKYHKEKEMLIEQEKAKIIAEHQQKMGNIEPEVESMEIDDEVTINLKKVEKSPLVENREKVMSSSIQVSTDVEMVSPIPKRKTTKSHMSDSAFVTGITLNWFLNSPNLGSMELKRNVVKQNERPVVDTKPRMTDSEFAELAQKLSLESIQQNKVP